MDEKTFTVIDENGNETLCEILLTFHSDEFEKNYVIYTMPGHEDEDEIEVSAACYSETNDDEGELLPIESDEEWDLIEQVLNDFEENGEEADA